MFRSARLHLTFWYLMIIMAISVSFSAVVFRILDAEIYRFARTQRARFEFRTENGILPEPGQRPQAPLQMLSTFDEELVRETEQRLLVSLVLVNAGIFITSGILGYALAGRTLRPIQHMVEEQHRFVSDASHELKTPLTILRTTLEVYLRGKRKDLHEANQIIASSLQEVQQLQHLSESLLSLAEQHNHHNTLTLQPILLTNMFSAAMQEVAVLARQKSISIEESDAQNDQTKKKRVTKKSIMVVGNEEALKHLLVILLDNAIKYSPMGSQVSLSADVRDRRVTISVVDRGMGISEQDLPKVFDRFYRADAARSSHDNGGYGLGLSIAQKIAHAHRTTLVVQSALGRGSTFSFTLPLA